MSGQDTAAKFQFACLPFWLAPLTALRDPAVVCLPSSCLYSPDLPAVPASELPGISVQIAAAVLARVPVFAGSGMADFAVHRCPELSCPGPGSVVRIRRGLRVSFSCSRSAVERVRVYAMLRMGCRGDTPPLEGIPAVYRRPWRVAKPLGFASAFHDLSRFFMIFPVLSRFRRTPESSLAARRLYHRRKPVVVAEVERPCRLASRNLALCTFLYPGVNISPTA